jgi:S-adenosylmethionine:diacylglycerol 3-amino-3-carboxypropyl transferase
MNSSSFQSIYTSLLTNEIILKDLNEKEGKGNKFKMWNKADRRGKKRIEWFGRKMNKGGRGGEEQRKVIKETLKNKIYKLYKKKQLSCTNRKRSKC